MSLFLSISVALNSLSISFSISVSVSLNSLSMSLCLSVSLKSMYLFFMTLSLSVDVIVDICLSQFIVSRLSFFFAGTNMDFENQNGVDPSYKLLPTEREWDLGIQICELLQPFHEITNLISGSTYPTSNLYFMQVYKIELWLKSHEKSSSEVIVEMVGAMKVKFDKYCREYSVILAMAAVFDPRFKLSLLDYCFTKLDDGTAEQKVVHVSDKLELLFKSNLNQKQKLLHQLETTQTIQ